MLPELTRHTPLGCNPARAEESRSPRGRGTRPRLSSARTEGPRDEAGGPAAGPGKGLLLALVSPRSQSHSTGTPQPRGTDALKREREKEATTGSNSWKPEQLLPQTPRLLSAALASPLPIFDLLLGGPVPPPHVPGVRTLVSPAGARVAGHRPLARSRPAPPDLASSWVVVTRRLCCETKSDPLALRQGREPGLLTPQSRAAGEGAQPPRAPNPEGARAPGPPARLHLRRCCFRGHRGQVREATWMGAAGARNNGAARRGQLRRQASCGDRPAPAAAPGPAALERCTWRDGSEAGLFSFGEGGPDWVVGGRSGVRLALLVVAIALCRVIARGGPVTGRRGSGGARR